MGFAVDVRHQLHLKRNEMAAAENLLIKARCARDARCRRPPTSNTVRASAHNSGAWGCDAGRGSSISLRSSLSSKFPTLTVLGPTSVTAPRPTRRRLGGRAQREDARGKAHTGASRCSPANEALSE